MRTFMRASKRTHKQSLSVAGALMGSLLMASALTPVRAADMTFERALNVATWKLPRSAPKDQEKITITLSKAGTAADNLKGEIRWAKPSPKDGPSADVVAIAPAPL